MCPENATAPAPTRANVTPTPVPHKPHTSKRAAAAVDSIKGNFGANEAPTVASTPTLTTMETGTGAGVNTGRGRGRPGKTTAPALAVTKTLKNESVSEDFEPVMKRVKTQESSSGTIIKVQIPISSDPACIRSDSDKENVDPGSDLRLKSKSTQKGNTLASIAHGKGKKRSVPRRSARKIRVENTEAYARCGEVVDCKGMCCGEPHCIYCFGEWEDSHG